MTKEQYTDKNRRRSRRGRRRVYLSAEEFRRGVKKSEPEIRALEQRLETSLKYAVRLRQ